MKQNRKINVGIGFVSGRKSFQKVLKTNIYNCLESGLISEKDISLNLFTAYDLKYSRTRKTDYTNISKNLLELIDKTYFIGRKAIQSDIDDLIDRNIVSEKEARCVFGSGYAGKRNIVLYTAMKNDMDYLIFLDDDEYPLAVTNTRSSAIWGGQHVLETHLSNIEDADITNGYHCGYVSPIPYMEFNDIMREEDFRLFIECISNDIINWDAIRSVMDNGGVTYADTKVLTSDNAVEVREKNHSKFISGSNLCINLTRPCRVKPFYNPPNARGEDTFLSTCLSRHKVLRVPCYTFHDGFSTYRHLMDGVLPIKLNHIKADSENIIRRFYRACIGWIRYKPLLLYITDRENYCRRIKDIRKGLEAVLPKVCEYFSCSDFNNVTAELDRYDRNVKAHYRQFTETQQAWTKISDTLIADHTGGEI